MGEIAESARRTPVAAEADVCVVGGSCTGVFAAVSAARLGARVVLIEANGFFGGVATAGLVNHWHSTLDTSYARPVIGGLTTEIIERLAQRGAVREQRPTEAVHYVLNTAELMVELDRLVAESGVRPFLHARFVAAAMEDGRVTAAVVEDKTGRRAVRAGYFIDATGDGDVVARAGLPVRKARTLQPPTTCAVVHGLEEIRRRNPKFSLDKAVFDSRHGGEIPLGFLWSSELVGVPDARMIAGTRVPGADCSDADELTAAEIEGRRQVGVICQILRRQPGGEGISLVSLPSCIGVRQTRQACCLHTLSEKELLSGERFDDAVANGTYRVDVHHSDKPGLTFRYLDGRQEYVVPGREPELSRWRPETTENHTFYQIPYRSLVPRGSRNVLVAGRLIDADEGAYGAVRVMVNCNQTGQAAGAAAHLALKGHLDVPDVSPQDLRAALSRQGAVVL